MTTRRLKIFRLYTGLMVTINRHCRVTSITLHQWNLLLSSNWLETPCLHTNEWKLNINKSAKSLPKIQLKRNGSLFTYLTATVTVNGLENEMSSELRFQGRKWGVASRVHP